MIPQQTKLEEQGWRGGRGEGARLPPMGSIQARCHMWVKFVIRSRFAPRILF